MTASASWAGWVHAPEMLERISGEETPKIFFAITELAGVAGTMVGACILDPLGRRPTLILAYSLGLVAYGLLLTPLATPHTIGWIWLLVGFVQGLMWPAMSTYLAEAFPTKLRGTGNGMAATFGRFANIAAPPAVGKVLAHSVYRALAMLMSFYLLAALFAFLIPQETSGRAMSDGLGEDPEKKSL